jgi:hypothetical protein
LIRDKEFSEKLIDPINTHLEEINCKIIKIVEDGINYFVYQNNEYPNLPLKCQCTKLTELLKYIFTDRKINISFSSIVDRSDLANESVKDEIIARIFTLQGISQYEIEEVYFNFDEILLRDKKTNSYFTISSKEFLSIFWKQYILGKLQNSKDFTTSFSSIKKYYVQRSELYSYKKSREF